jgi:hypothetical protein
MDQQRVGYSKKDSKRYTPDMHLIGSIWMHTGTNMLYIITDYMWGCDEDVWYIAYKRYLQNEKIDTNDVYENEYGDRVTFVRSIENFKGKRDGVDRFIRIKTD